MKKSILAWVLICSLCLLAGCGSGTDKAASATPAATSQGSEAASPEVSAPSATDTVVLKVFKEGARPMNDQTEMIRKWAIDNLQVDIQLTQVSENFNQQLALLISSGDIPDLTMLPYNSYVDYAQQGAFTDITDYVKNYEDLMKYVGDYWDKVKFDGKIYAVPSILDVPTSLVTNVRKDWLDKLNLSIPKTLDEFTNVMRAFTKNDPDGNGKNDTYGFSGAGFKFISQLVGAFGASADQSYTLNSDGKVVTNAISDNYREGLRYLRGIYKEGLVDPEIFTATSDQAYQKWGRGQMGVWTSWWSHAGNAYLRYGFKDLQPNAKVEIIYPPVGANGEQGSLYAPTFDTVLAIAHDLPEDKVNAALRLLNCQATQYGFYTFMYGIEDVDFTVDDKGLITWQYALDGKDKLGNEVTDMEVYKLLYQEKLQRYADSLAKDDANALYWAATQVQYDTKAKENIFAFTITEEFIDNNAELQKFFEESSIRFIMGDSDIDKDWDKYKADYLSMGGEAVRQSLLKAYNANTGKNLTFAD